MLETFGLQTQEDGPAFEEMNFMLGSEGMAMLFRQLRIWAELNKRELKSPLREALKNGDTALPEGTLMHGTGRRGLKPETFKSIASLGILSGELVGISEESETHGCADFFRVANESTIDQYFNWAGETKLPEAGIIAPPKRRSERLLLNSVSFIVDPNAEGMQELLEYDGYRNPKMAGFIRPLSGRDGEDTAAILGGVPRGAIAGIIIPNGLDGGFLRRNPGVLPALREYFPDMPAFTIDGKRLALEPSA